MKVLEWLTPEGAYPKGSSLPSRSPQSRLPLPPSLPPSLGQQPGGPAATTFCLVSDGE